MGITVDTSEVRDVSSRLSTAGVRVGAANAVVFRKTLFDIQADARILSEVDTGAQRDSISVEISGDGRFGAITGEVGPTTEYSRFREFGTSTDPGKPFMGPAFDSRIPSYLAALGNLAARETL